MNLDLPDGWTIERVRSLSGDDTATLISADRPVALWNGLEKAEQEANIRKNLLKGPEG